MADFQNNFPDSTDIPPMEKPVTPQAEQTGEPQKRLCKETIPKRVRRIR